MSKHAHNNTRPQRHIVARAWLLSAACAIVLSAATATAAATHATQPRAAAAGTLNVTDEAHLQLNRRASSGEVLIEEGSATGQLPGRVKARFIFGETISVQVTIYPTRGGSISAKGQERVHYSNRYASFGGSISVTGGTGPYRHARGSGGFYGVVDRRSDASTVQTTGKLSY